MYKILRRLILEQERINKRDTLKSKLQDTFGFTPSIVKWIMEIDQKRAVILARWIIAKMEQQESGSSKDLKSSDQTARKKAVGVAEEAVEQVNVSARPLFDLLQQIGESGKPFDIRPYATVEDALSACMEEANSRGIEFNIDEDQTVVMKFSNGWYWLDLGKRHCEEEAEEMQHCATASGDTLISLRDPLHKAHVTIDYQFDGGVLRQIKGKNNAKPIPEYHPYIVDFIVNEDHNGYYVGNLELQESYGYAGSDFMLGDLSQELFNKVLSERHDLFGIKEYISAIKHSRITMQQIAEMSPELFSVTRKDYTQSLDGDGVKIVMSPHVLSWLVGDDNQRFMGLIDGTGYDSPYPDQFHDIEFSEQAEYLSHDAQIAALGLAAKMGFEYDSIEDLCDDLESDSGMRELRYKLNTSINKAHDWAQSNATESEMYRRIYNWFKNILFDTFNGDSSGKFNATLSFQYIYQIVNTLGRETDDQETENLDKFDVIEIYEKLKNTEYGQSEEFDLSDVDAYPSNEEISEQFIEALLND